MRRFAAVVLAGALLTACGGSSGDDGPRSAAAPTPSVDVPPAATQGDTPSGELADTAWARSFTGVDIWVDPVHGDDDADGHDRTHAMRTIDAAWRAIPAGAPLTVGHRLLLVAGTYPQATSVNYWEDRHGTVGAPIVVEAADGPHTAVFEADLNMFEVSYFALVGVDVIRQGDAFHCERCDHVVLSQVEFSGGGVAHDLVKINQSQHVFIEDADLHGAEDNALDFVAVQYGHVAGTRIHDAQDWCAYAKGGSAHVTFAGNEVFDCGTGGITAGQGTGFEFMTAPWLNYEAYGIRIVDNVIHHTEGAGLGVAGGFNVLFAGNTLYAVGARSHLVEFVHGRRGCDGMADVCAEHHDAGGWGSTAGEEALIPNRHVYFYDNVVVNPDGMRSEWQHFQVDGPLDVPSSSNVPSPSVADDDLRIAGNLVWNGPADHPSGLGEGCPDTNPTCNEARLRSDNSINLAIVRLRDPEHGDFRLTAESEALRPAATERPEFQWDATPIPVPH